jgi:hypothetical protein
MNNIDDDWENFLHDNLEKKDNELSKNISKPIFSNLYISTKTKICYLNQEIDIHNLFWKLKLINYNDFSEGIIKKQIKVSCLNNDEVIILEKNIENEKNNNINIINLSKIDNPQGRIKFKDIRKISIGLCKKDLINSRTKEKSAFYNCFVLVIRILFDDIFKEVHVKVFNTGKLEIPGIQSDFMLNKILEYLKNYLCQFITNINYKNESETVLINSNFNCGFFIDRDKLFNILRYNYNINSCYDPCSYPGIQSHFYYDVEMDIENQNGLQKNNIEQIKISFMIFRTGSILIVGKCEENIIYYIYNFIKKIIEKEFSLISKCINNNKKEITNKKSKKKTIVFVS